jgi:hypothetical protein
VKARAVCVLGVGKNGVVAKVVRLQEVCGCKELQRSEAIYKLSCNVAFLRCDGPKSLLCASFQFLTPVGVSKKPLCLKLSPVTYPWAFPCSW